MISQHEWQAVLARHPEGAKALADLAVDLLNSYGAELIADYADGDASDLDVRQVRKPVGGKLTRAECHEFRNRLQAAEMTEDRIAMAITAISIIRLASGAIL